ncbi:hypothetical protein [Parasitella parasitica]|uniref:Uncharacterized protein n=1 Tax=Parasitella parasitica TaxID=35722 RepID=A0A0B7NFF9_9FUNG|nr:hypothetical protein [Parasitella parasitica]
MSSWWSVGGGAAAKKEPVVAAQAAASLQSFKAMSTAFRKGVQYNMKVVLRGDVMIGKSNYCSYTVKVKFMHWLTAKVHRLQGSEFSEEYTSTPQILSSKYTLALQSDTKIDSATTSIPPSPQQQQQEDQDVAIGLDASTVNVYRNTHGAILIPPSRGHLITSWQHHT